jgi:hypothetical protein
VRGIVLQYSSAALQAGGLTAEYAPRLICTLCSLLSIAATLAKLRHKYLPLIWAAS